MKNIYISFEFLFIDKIIVLNMTKNLSLNKISGTKSTLASEALIISIFSVIGFLNH